MTPFNQALELYTTNGYNLSSLRKDILWHMVNGYVISTPLELLLFRPVSSKWDDDTISGMRFGKCLEMDSWHVSLAVGVDLRDLVAYTPYKLKYISFERRGKFKRYPTSKFHEKAKSTCTTKTGPTSSGE